MQIASIRSLLAVCALFLLALGACRGEETQEIAVEPLTKAAQVPQPKDVKKAIKSAVDRGIKFIRTHQDGKSGAVRFIAGNEKTAHPGLTGMALLCYLRSHRGYTMADGPFVGRALEWLVSLQKEDGSIYLHDSAQYCTSVALTAIAESGEKRFEGARQRALDYLVAIQASEDTGYSKGDRFYGGVGYGGDERPDLSNTQFGVEAARAAGLPSDHAFFQRAAIFASRTQNHGETNDQEWKSPSGVVVRPGNDGGAMYLPGESKAGIEVLPDGRRVFRSYGSMSYALLKSFIFCDLKRADPRVKAVARWVQENFTLERHPGFMVGDAGDEPWQGLYYYYFSMARALSVYGQDTWTTKAGIKHDWRRELASELISQQIDSGAFLNTRSPRWNENAPILCTLYGVLALEECLKALD